MRGRTPQTTPFPPYLSLQESEETDGRDGELPLVGPGRGSGGLRAPWSRTPDLYQTPYRPWSCRLHPRLFEVSSFLRVTDPGGVLVSLVC